MHAGRDVQGSGRLELVADDSVYDYEKRTATGRLAAHQLVRRLGSVASTYHHQR